MREVRVLVALLRRDLLDALSYKSQVVSRIASVGAFLFSAWFMAQTFAGREPESVGGPGGYFGFLLYGVALSDLSWALMNGPSDRVRRAQLRGTLEVAYAAGLRGARLPLFEGLSAFSGAGLRVLGYFMGAWLLIDFTPTVTDPKAALLAALLSFTAMLPVGVLGGSLTLLLKRADPVGRALYAASMLASGVLYPTSVLPAWLATCAELLPMTHALRALRGAFLWGADLSALSGTLWALAGFSVVGGVLAWALGRQADRLARRLGSLGHY